MSMRILEWNRKRNGLQFDPLLEIKMLTEEANEFFMAETKAERLSEAADFLFVTNGTLVKFAASKAESVDGFLNGYAKWQQLNQWMDEVLVLIHTALQEDGTDGLLSAALLIITSANEAKSAEKSAEGKVIKGADYVSPIKLIEELIARNR